MAPGLTGQEGPRRVIEADELPLVEAVGVDALLEALHVLLGHVVERAPVAVAVAVAVAVPPFVAHEPPPAPAPAPTGTPGPGPPGTWDCACGPAPRPVAMLKAPEPCSRAL
jgi:hypothetical protein